MATMEGDDCREYPSGMRVVSMIRHAERAMSDDSDNYPGYEIEGPLLELALYASDRGAVMSLRDDKDAFKAFALEAFSTRGESALSRAFSGSALGEIRLLGSIFSFVSTEATLHIALVRNLAAVHCKRYKTQDVVVMEQMKAVQHHRRYSGGHVPPYDEYLKAKTAGVRRMLDADARLVFQNFYVQNSDLLQVLGHEMLFRMQQTDEARTHNAIVLCKIAAAHAENVLETIPGYWLKSRKNLPPQEAYALEPLRMPTPLTTVVTSGDLVTSATNRLTRPSVTLDYSVSRERMRIFKTVYYLLLNRLGDPMYIDTTCACALEHALAMDRADLLLIMLVFSYKVHGDAYTMAVCQHLRVRYENRALPHSSAILSLAAVSSVDTLLETRRQGDLPIGVTEVNMVGMFDSMLNELNTKL